MSPNHSNSHPVTHKTKEFPETNWPQIAKLSSSDPIARHKALTVIAENYWAPILVFLRRMGLSEQEAQDEVQDFFAFAIESDLFSKADADRGRFRSYLIGALRNHFAKVRRAQTAAKRRPAGGIGSFNESGGQAAEEHTDRSVSPEDVFHQAWLRQVILRTASTLQDEFASSGKQSHFELMYSRVIVAELDGQAHISLEEQALAWGLTPKEASNQIVTAKRAFRRLLADEIGSYALSHQDKEAEVRDALGLMKI